MPTRQPPPSVIVRDRRKALAPSTDASKLTVTAPTVFAIVIAVLSFAAQWYNVQSRLGEIQTAVQLLDAKIDKQDEVSAVGMKQRDARIEELEKTQKAFEIRVRQLETDLARTGRRAP